MERYLTLPEVAERLRLSVQTLRRDVRSGRLESIRVGKQRQVRIDEAALQRYLGRDGRSCVAETRPEYSARSTPLVKEGTTGHGVAWKVLQGDVRDGLAALKPASVHCVVTSPPYYWQRDYEVDGQIGHEPSIDGYVSALVETFTGVWRALRDDGVFFLNLGDTYYSAKGKPHGRDKKHGGRQMARRLLRAVDGPGLGVPRKTLIGIPWRVALGMQQAGWTLRSDVIWRRPGSLPEPTAKDRPWRTFEHVFIFTKGPHYWFDRSVLGEDEDVWTLVARPRNTGVHFAPYPVELVERCLACGCPPRGVVLDPFVGSGSTMLAALSRGSPAIGIDLKPEYCDLTIRRIADQDKQRSAWRAKSIQARAAR